MFNLPLQGIFVAFTCFSPPLFIFLVFSLPPPPIHGGAPNFGRRIFGSRIKISPPPQIRIFFEAKIEILKANFRLFFVILEVNSGKIEKILGLWPKIDVFYSKIAKNWENFENLGMKS